MKIFILGGGGHSKVIINILRLDNCEIGGIYDDNKNKNETIYGIECIGTIGSIKNSFNENKGYICGIGDNIIRKKITDKLDRLNWINCIHPNATVPSCLNLGVGNVICAGAVIEPDTTIGNFNIINTLSSINHDCKIKNYVHIAPNSTLCGNIIVEDCALIGASSVILPNKRIGKNTIVGAGSVVLNDVGSNLVVYGNPVKS